jgi:DNA topoisomerase-1
MRTDSLRISEESRANANEYILNTYGKDYLPEKPRYFKTKANAQDGHEAIRPTMMAITPELAKSSLTADQYKLYNLIWKRFVASLMANCVQDTVKAEITGANEADKANGRFITFVANGYSVRFDGYTRLYETGTDEDEEEEGKLPKINEGDAIKIKELVGNQHFTQPPARYTEASLIKALEETGVGRPSTYASIISTITQREYVIREQKQLKPTELGEAITNLLKDKFTKIVNVKFTAVFVIFIRVEH